MKKYIFSALFISFFGFVFTTHAAPSVNVTSPNGGEILTIGSTHRITWASSNVDTINIGYSFGPGSLNWIATNVSNVGYYDWNVNIGNTTNMQVKISIIGYQTGTGSASDESDNYFTVKQPTSIKIISPNGGETFQAGSSIQTQWTSSGLTGTNVNIQLVNENTVVVHTFLQNLYMYGDLAPGSASSLLIPSTIPSGKYYFRVMCSKESSCFGVEDMSDATFTILNGNFPSSIKVLYPNGGEKFIQGDPQGVNLKFAFPAGVTQFDYQIFKGPKEAKLIFSPVSPINVGVNQNVYLDSSMFPVGDDYFLRVYDWNNRQILDDSDAPFSIVLGLPIPPNPIPLPSPIPVTPPSGLSEPQIQSILSLLQSFGADQNVINNVSVSLRGGATGPVPTALPPSSNADIDPNPQVSVCTSLIYGLRYQTRDAEVNGDVSALQDFLAARGYFNQDPTGYFGVVTLNAIKKFQSANGISPTGFVGPLTRAKIKALTCN